MPGLPGCPTSLVLLFPHGCWQGTSFSWQGTLCEKCGGHGAASADNGLDVVRIAKTLSLPLYSRSPLPAADKPGTKGLQGRAPGLPGQHPRQGGGWERAQTFRGPGEAGRDGESWAYVYGHLQEVWVSAHARVCTSGYTCACRPGPGHIREALPCSGAHVWGVLPVGLRQV